MNYVAIDVETTGLEPGSRLVELAAAAFDDSGVQSTFSELIDPGMPLPPDVTKISGITQEMLDGARTTEQVLSDFFAWLPDDPIIVAHWAQFDTGMIAWAAGHNNIEIPDLRVICTCRMAKSAGNTKNNKLTTLEQYHELKREGDPHRALSDADVCRQYFQLMHASIRPATVPWAEAGHDYEFAYDFPESLRTLPVRVVNGDPLTFTYTDAKDETTERTITPYGWARVKGELMFHGWCQLREARRTFRMDRVQEVKKS